MSNAQTYGEWIRQIKNFKGGWLGLLVVLYTLAATAIGGWYGLQLFPPGNYPQLVLIMRGLLIGALSFFLASRLLWKLKR